MGVDGDGPSSVLGDSGRYVMTLAGNAGFDREDHLAGSGEIPGHKAAREISRFEIRMGGT